MSFYQRHIFFCTNRRESEPDRPGCAAFGAVEARAHAKERIRQLGLARPGQVRVNTAGCMNRCALGPVCVVYPEGVWYRYENRQDVDEIIDRHLEKGEIVERLRLADNARP